ncbi:conserved hypothetical protein [Talaromyces stipitatus ATCC 10500]|uniref:Cell wall protein n=1 Tax=Talaromyces stipitatus (strain ATCC 10500 / CBS 375.48 / QM 6759 / NRRL 1006) TaxID=441959 RepID=B8MIZ7_TALSN|nr:uncharacterized protein TSTA_050970 [Talaromyces stipitatus ATCC 10500]EED15659.1 conserved hypothetical protein [Talaromyces stipitatus ATCC 10500]
MSTSMKSLMILFLAAMATARPLSRREVPQEHSHQKFIATVAASLAANNPDNIGDPVFGLLGNKAAAQGAGSIKDLDCLQQAIADQAFTNAKAAGDVNGMTAALVYRTLERNTGSVGLASVKCTSVKAKNPEIAALQQHQDPASSGAAATNKQIALELAKQIASIGGDPSTAIQSGTFAPGQIGDTTGKGKTCDDQNDPTGCIFTQNLLVPDVTQDEINAAVGSAGGSAAAAPSASAAVAASSSAGIAAAPTATAASSSNQASTGTCSSSTGASDSATGANAATNNNASTSTTPSTSSLDLGSCKNASPFIKFGAGFDGRKENSFEPADKATFNHGSALNIGVVANFICDRLNDPCKASQTTLDTCKSAASAASKLSGQAAADAFNKALS